MLTILGGGCALLQGPPPPPAAATVSPVSATPAASTPSPQPTSIPTPSGPITLTVWLPPAFDPAADTPAAELLRTRLQAFEQRRPDVRVQVRIKDTDGTGGMMHSLSTAAAAAPDVLPNLALVSQDMLETGVLKGLFYPFDNLISLTDADWFDFPQQLGQFQGSVFGIPFAADALVMVYRPDKIVEPPVDWATLTETPAPLLFAANDSQTAYPLLLYFAEGGGLQDEAGRPIFQPGPLNEVLARLDEAHRVGRFPVYLLQYSTAEAVWQAYEGETAAMSIVWLSSFLQSNDHNSALALPPTPAGTPASIGTTWLWAMPSAKEQELSAELAAYLTLPEFMAQWCQAAGYLPTRNSALALWTEDAQRTFLLQVVQAARPMPPASVRTVLSPLLSTAVEQILQEKSTPEEAASMILEKFTSSP
ncbi:MAG: extracellular solute-binding protein [Anaerolineae bacterium]|nr:MAG: extracellular solute-binding protein [Anaerolineae bacterium]